MAENSEIPGFYKCPRTGKYFRIPAGGDPVGKIASNKTRPVYQQKINKYGAHKLNIPSLFNRMQIGLPSRKFEDEYWMSKFANFVKPTSQSNICSLNCRLLSQSMLLRSTEKTIFYESEYFNGHFKHNCFHEHKMPVDNTLLHSNEAYRTIHCRFSGPPVDICKLVYSYHEHFVRIMNSRFAEGMIVIVITSDSTENRTVETIDVPAKQPVWCCTANGATGKVFLGTIGGAGTFTVDAHHSRFLPPSRRLTKGNAHSIDADTKGDTLYCGLHNGLVMIKDRREENVATTIRLYERDGLNEIKLLNNQHHLICGSFKGQLSMLDLRTGGCIATYFGHKSAPKKLPLSVLESQQLLCATGTDKITRLWSLNGGEPLASVFPPSVTNKVSSCVEDSSPCQACLCHSDELDSLCILQGCAVHVYPLNNFGLDNT